MRICLYYVAKYSIDFSKRSASILDFESGDRHRRRPSWLWAHRTKPDGTVEAIVEEYVATHDQRQIKELNVGAYCFQSDWLWDALHRIEKNPKKGEYYLTDVVELAAKDDLPVQAVVQHNLVEIIGINNRHPLKRSRDRHADTYQSRTHVGRRQHDESRLCLYRSRSKDRQRYDHPAKHPHPG